MGLLTTIWCLFCLRGWKLWENTDSGKLFFDFLFITAVFCDTLTIRWVFLSVMVGWENRWHFAMPPTISPQNDVWETSAEIPYWQCHYEDLRTASDWLCDLWNLLQPIWTTTSLDSDVSSVWNFCPCFSDVISWRNCWWRRKISSVFSGYCYG